MNDSAYPACIRDLYESEIFGEALFRVIVDLAKNPRERYHLGTLLQLETETKARLRPLLFKHGIPLNETMNLADVEQAVAGYQAATWLEFTAANIPVVQAFLSRFEAIVALGAAEDQQVLQSMVRHETAILKWLTMESCGNTHGSLDDIIVQLQYPLPAPAGI